MAVASWRPDLGVQVAFNADPNDPTTAAVWTDLTSVFRSAQQVTRGRQYELDQNQAAQPTLSFLDQNEYLNPANPNSPYAPNVVPYRQLLWQAMWPNGGTGNLLNTGAQGVSYDPSFESYTTGTTPTWIMHTGTGVNPVISTSNPFQGTKSLQYSVASGGGESGVGLTIPCIPGRQYTTSLYIRQTAANTNQIFIDAGPSGSTTATTGSYVRLTLTWTATQPRHNVWVVSFTTGTSGTVNVDAIQHEPSATASTFTTSGPVIYGVMRGYVERWPSRWDYMGYLGEADLIAVDAYAPLNLIPIGPEYQTALAGTQPDYWWTMSGSQDTTSWQDVSGNNGPSLTLLDSSEGPGTFAAGVQTNVPGDPGGTGIQTNTDDTGDSVFVPATVAQAGIQGTYTPTITIGSLTPPYSYSMAAWITHDPTATEDGRVFLALDVLGTWPATADTFYAKWALSVFDGELSFSTRHVNSNSIPDDYADGKPHLFVTTTSVTSSSATLTVYIDGVQVDTTTGTTALTNNTPATMVQVGGYLQTTLRYGTTGLANGIYSDVALWNRLVTATEVAGLYQAGLGGPDETSGERITRYLSEGNWHGLTAIDVGQSIMGVSNLQPNTALLAACQDITTTENGDFYVDSLGQLTFASRTRRYLETTSLYTFGERVDLGEYPYEGDIAFDFDPTLVYSVVEVDNSDGITAIATNKASQLAYFPRAYQRDVNLASDEETVDAATYLLNQHAQPHLRVNTITLDPVGTPALWPVVLSLEIGQRVTVKRRTTAANNGAGLTISADFFVENISHDQIDMGTDQRDPSWLVTLYLSPVDISQVGILGDSTYGRLGTGGAQLASSITASATTCSVTLTGGDLFTTAGVPFPAAIDQEIVTVTAVSGASSPQTLTITRPTNGTAAAHSAAAPVQVYQPFVLAY